MSNLSLYELLPTIKEVLELGKEALFVPSGKSMLPFLLGGKSEVAIKKPTFPLKKYDISLYKTAEGLLVLHRVVRVSTKGNETVYTFRGDNTYLNEENITEKQILAVVTRFKRKTGWQAVDDKSYMFFVRLWTAFYPLRKALRFLVLLPFRAIRKIKRIIFG